MTCADHPATAVNDSATVDENSAANTIDVRANDTDPDTANGASKDLIADKTNGTHGSVAITHSGADLTYTPNANYCGPDSFTYKLSGGSQATVSITVSCAPRTLSVTKDGSGSGTVSSTPAGIDCGSDCSESFAKNTVVTLTAAANADSELTGFSANCSPVSGHPEQCTIAADETKSVTATFTLKRAAPVSDPAPETTIGHVPHNRKHNHTHFRFHSSIAGSTFTCQLDREAPESCRSPQDYRDLEPGRHKFKVFATSPKGVSDPTPAKARFRVRLPSS